MRARRCRIYIDLRQLLNERSKCTHRSHSILHFRSQMPLPRKRQTYFWPPSLSRNPKIYAIRLHASRTARCPISSRSLLVRHFKHGYVMHYLSHTIRSLIDDTLPASLYAHFHISGTSRKFESAISPQPLNCVLTAQRNTLHPAYSSDRRSAGSAVSPLQRHRLHPRLSSSSTPGISSLVFYASLPRLPRAAGTFHFVFASLLSRRGHLGDLS